MSKKTADKSPQHEHNGHRQRMRDRFIEMGMSFSGFRPHEVLEMMLFFAYKRRNTNPLAHLLIKKFGTVDDSLHADEQELCEIPGIGKAAAEHLQFYGELLDFCDNEEID